MRTRVIVISVLFIAFSAIPSLTYAEVEPTSSVDVDNILYLPSSHEFEIPVRTFGLGGQKTPVVMLHGLQSHSGWFTQSATVIADNGHPVYIMDRLGSGASKAPRGSFISVNAFMEDILSVVKHAQGEHKIENVYLVGHCFGAIPASRFATLHSDLVKSLILTTPAIFTELRVPFSHKMKLLWDAMTPMNTRINVSLDVELFSEIEHYQSFINSDPLAVHEVDGPLLLGAARMRNGTLRRRRRLDMPIFMTSASEDSISNNSKNEKFFASLPASVKMYRSYGEVQHILEFSGQKEAFFTDLVNWLNDIEGRG